MAAPLQGVPALDSTLGAIQIGIVISLCLYGAMCVQVFTYYQAGFKKEYTYVRLMVVWCLVVETVHTVFITNYLYESTIKHFGDYSYLPVAQWPLSFSVATSTFVSAPVQIFFAFRVYAISKSWYFPAASTFASVMRTGLSIACSVLGDEAPSVAVLEQKYLYLIAWAIAIGGVVDVANTVALCYYLVKSKPEINRSRMIIDKLVIWTIETGLLTSLCNVVGLALLLSMTHNTVWLCPIMFSAKLYSNSFYATLNGRLSLRASSSRADAITMSSFHSSQGRSAPTKVEIVQETSVSRGPHDAGLSRIVKLETGDYDRAGSGTLNGDQSQKDLKAESLSEDV